VGSADLVEAADPHGLELRGLAAVELGDKRSGDVPPDRRLCTCLKRVSGNTQGLVERQGNSHERTPPWIVANRWTLFRRALGRGGAASSSGTAISAYDRQEVRFGHRRHR
jgi:hypothetical protein